MPLEDHLRDIIQRSLGSTPEQMLETSLNACIQLAEAQGGSILAEEGPHLRFLFSDVADLIGMAVPFDSIAGTAARNSLVVYTYAPADDRHFAGVDDRLRRQTHYLLSVPIPSVLTSSGETRRASNAGVLQLLFNEDIAPELTAGRLPCEFGLDAFKEQPLYDRHLKGIFSVLPIIAFGMEVMSLRQTSYQVIHELKNKFIAGLSWLDFLKDDLQAKAPAALTDAGIRDDAELAETSIREGAELAKRYLQLTRIYTPAFADTPINTVLRDVAASARALGAQQGAPQLQVIEELTTADTVRRVDAGQLKMAFFNLLKNAVEVLAERKVSTPRVTVASARVGDQIEVTIGDNGPGMPPEIADNLFVAFKTKKEGGTGLGLTITKKIIDIHGGSIRCETGTQGTRFIATI